MEFIFRIYWLIDYVESSGAGIYLNCTTRKEKNKRKKVMWIWVPKLLWAVSRVLVGKLKNSLPFLELKASFLFSKPSTGHCPEPDDSSLFKINFTLILPSTQRWSNWPVPFRFPSQNFVCISILFCIVQILLS